MSSGQLNSMGSDGSQRRSGRARSISNPFFTLFCVIELQIAVNLEYMQIRDEKHAFEIIARAQYTSSALFTSLIESNKLLNDCISKMNIWLTLSRLLIKWVRLEHYPHYISTATN